MSEAFNVAEITDLADLLCAPDAPMRVILRRMDATYGTFQLVVDTSHRLLGTITDGDVRRALMAGANVEEPVSRFMQGSPVTGDVANRAGALAKLASTKSIVPFLPLIDAAGKVRSVLIQRRADRAFPMALVMAGGRGARLGDKTQNTPKPLLPVGDAPMLEHVLKSIEGAGIRRIFISAHYLAEQIESFCKARLGDAQLAVLREDFPFGTAGAISLIPDDVQGPVLVMNGDVVSNVDLTAMYELHAHQKWDATIAVARHEVQIPYGVIRTNDSATFLGIEEKPVVKNFVAAGIYILNDPLRRLVPRNTRIDMPQLLEIGRNAGLRIGVFPLHENWRDVGRPADLDAANNETRYAR